MPVEENLRLNLHVHINLILIGLHPVNTGTEDAPASADRSVIHQLRKTRRSCLCMSVGPDHASHRTHYNQVPYRM